PGIAVGSAAAQGRIAAGKAAESLRTETTSRLAEAEGRIIAGVQAENARHSDELLRADGPVRRAEGVANSAFDAATRASSQLNAKADMALVGKLLSGRP